MYPLASILRAVYIRPKYDLSSSTAYHFEMNFELAASICGVLSSA
jgi:hypothetical protein